MQKYTLKSENIKNWIIKSCCAIDIYYIPRRKSGIYWIQVRRRRRNILVDAITQKQINIFFSNLVHMLRVPKGRSLF